MQALSRIPIVFNRIAPTIDAVSGAEIGNRQQVQYFPRQVGDTAIDDILTQGAEWIMDECEGNEEDSDAFRDALICGVGVTETRPDFDKDSRITKERVDPLEVNWDPSSRKACFADARYLRRKRPMSTRQLPRDVPRLGDGGRPRPQQPSAGDRGPAHPVRRHQRHQRHPRGRGDRPRVPVVRQRAAPLWSAACMRR